MRQPCRTEAVLLNWECDGHGWQIRFEFHGRLMKRFRPVVAIGVLVVLAGAFFWPVLAHPEQLMTSGRGDLVQLFAVRTQYQVANTLKTGELSLWDPYADCGAPVVGNIQNATFYPLNILFYIMPTDSAFGFIFLADTLLAGLFAYVFVRSFGLSRGAGLAGAVTYMFSGIWTPKLFPGHIMVYNNFPWIILGLYLVRKVVLSARDGKWSGSVFFTMLLAISQGVQFLGGHTQFWVYSTFFLIMFGLFEVLVGIKDSGSMRPAAGGGLIFAALAVCTVLVMIQLLPTMEFAGQVLDEGKRPADYRTYGGFARAERVMVVAPRYYGSAERHSYWGGVPQWEVSPYVGILPLVLVFSAPFVVRNRYVWYFCAAGIVAVLFSQGGDAALFQVLVQLPGFSAFRVPARMLTLVLPAVVMLVGFAWERLFVNRPKGSKWVRIISVAMALLLAAYVAQLFLSNRTHEGEITAVWRAEIQRRIERDPMPEHRMFYREAQERAGENIAEAQREFLIGAGQCVVAAALFALAGLGGRVRIACGAVALAVIAADLMSFGMPFVQTLPVNDKKVYPEHTLLLDSLNALAKGDRLFRICDYNTPVGSEMVYQQLRRRDFNLLGGDLDSSKLQYAQEYILHANQETNDINNALNVKYYISWRPMQEFQKEFVQFKRSGEVVRGFQGGDMAAYGAALPAGDLYITENMECFPRAYVVRKVRPMIGDTPEEVMRFLETKKMMRTLAVIEEKPDFTLTGKGDLQPANVTEYSPNRITVEVSLGEPGFLVLSEIWYPDWHAYDVADGGRTELHVYRTNVAMRGVFLKAGKHKVEFVYEPRSYYVGKMVTLVTIPVVLALLLISGIVARKAHD